MNQDFWVDQLQVHVSADANTMGARAARAALEVMKATLSRQAVCRMIVASANSQLPFFSHLQNLPVPWQQLELFHMDEYLGLPPGHPASFSGFINNHLIRDHSVLGFHAIDGMTNSVLEECLRYDHLLAQAPIDLCCLGIGENGHIAFNEPDQADFHDPVRLKAVRLDPISRNQQVKEGHFPSLERVPTHAITLTIPALVSAQSVIGIVPDERKARAVNVTLQSAVNEQIPASILRQTPNARLFLDQAAAKEWLAKT